MTEFLGKGTLETGFQKPLLTEGNAYEFELGMYSPTGPDGLLKRPQRIENIQNLAGVEIVEDRGETLHIKVTGITQQIFHSLENEGTAGPFLLQ